MAKLGYTWYPKDWGNSEAVFELTLLERGLYRELIDMAMLNDNQTVINDKVWARKFGSSVVEIESILLTLEELKLIEVTNEFLFIPSCEARLNMVRGGRNGGKKSKPTNKGTSKGIVKGDSNQKKEKEKEKVKETIPTESEFLKYALSKEPNLDHSAVKLKYDAWVVNGWKNGNDKPIKNWKSSLNNTIPHINKRKQGDNYQAPKNLKDMFQ